MADAEEEQLRFSVGGKEFTVVSLDDLEFGEIELIEDAFDESFEEIDFNRAKAWRWLIYISMRRTDPDVKFDDLGALKFSEIVLQPEKEKPKPKRPTKKAPVKAA